MKCAEACMFAFMHFECGIIIFQMIFHMAENFCQCDEGDLVFYVINTRLKIGTAVRAGVKLAKFSPG